MSYGNIRCSFAGSVVVSHSMVDQGTPEEKETGYSQGELGVHNIRLCQL